MMQSPQLSAPGNRTSPIVVYGGLLALCLALLCVPTLLLSPLSLEALTQQITYLALGMTGAIFANSTGAGGGVVFVPVFHHLGFTEAQTIATSFGIQCFGMTAGAIAWSRYLGREDHRVASRQSLLPIVALCSTSSIAGIWTVYTLNLTSPAAVSSLFASLSLLLGVAVLLVVIRGDSKQPRSTIVGADLAVLPLVAYLGGLITAWLSVGVGEFIAFYLILRRYDARMAVAIAVIISAITVWSAAPEQLLFNQQANWQVLAFAGPGAVVGGLLARHLVVYLGAIRLKLFFGTWLLIIGVTEFIPFI